jgi:ParB family chromosome partitioning protein
MDLKMLPVCNIKSEEHRQRIEIDEEKMSELVASVRSDGLLQPITVKADGEGFIVVFGHRRLEACKRAGWTEIPAFVAQGDEATLRGLTFAENFFRDDLTPVELALAIADEFKSGRMTIERIAQGFKRSTDWVRRQIAICGWPKDVLQTMHTGKLSVGAAANLALIEEPEYREFLCRQAVENGATARATAAWLQAWRSMMPASQAINQPPAPAGINVLPMVPQAPCLACGTVCRTDALSYVPICTSCVGVIRNASNPQPA